MKFSTVLFGKESKIGALGFPDFASDYHKMTEDYCGFSRKKIFN
jgi:hypothetical protein